MTLACSQKTVYPGRKNSVGVKLSIYFFHYLLRMPVLNAPAILCLINIHHSAGEVNPA
jgi:hypothetical protein